MRKLHKAALIVAAASSLSAVGIGASQADAPAGRDNATPASVPDQPVAQAAAPAPASESQKP